KGHVDKALLESYNKLASAKTWIFCEKELESMNSFVLNNWKERLFFERLERKATPVMALAAETGNDWEAVLFCFIAKYFGLNTNGSVFYDIAKSVPFSVIRKESFEKENMEALLLGRAGLLGADYEDVYAKDLKARYGYLCHKYNIAPVYIDEVQFF